MRHHHSARGGILGAALGAFLSLPAAARELTVAVGGAFTSMDPHFFDLSPNHALTWHVFDRLVHPDAVEGIDYDLDALTSVWRATNDQDRALVANTQRGCANPGYVPGPYSMVEDDVEAFVNWYVTRLREQIA